MNRIGKTSGRILATAAAAVLPATAAVAVDSLRGDIGGLWYDPATSGQGLQIDVLDGGRAVISWYTYDDDGSPLWLSGLGQATGSQITAMVQSASGGRFPTNPVQPSPTLVDRGQVNIDFSDCNHATASFDAADGGLPSGDFELFRLASPEGTRCGAMEEFSEIRVFSFQSGPGRFNPLFADLPVDGQDIFELDFAHAPIPVPLEGRSGLSLTGMNRSDDLAMMIEGPVEGLLPSQTYQVEIEMEFASSVPSGCIGIGGAPGESVYVKLGAVGYRPDVEEVQEPGRTMLRPNFGFGNQANSGEDAVVVGDMANSQTCDDPQGEWELKTVSTEGQELRVESNEDGTIWVVAGTDSGFEGLTRYYIISLRVRLQPVSGES